MKKNLKNLAKFLMLLILVSSCQDDDKKFGDLVTPTNLNITYEIVGKDGANPDGDGTGKVNLKATADNATSYKFFFSDETNANSPTGEMTKQFTKNGVNTYTVTAVAYGTGGNSSSTSIEVTVFSDFSDPEAVQFITGGSTKTWYWAASKAGHLGVGPNDATDAGAVPQYYAAAPYEKSAATCFYKEKLVFTKDGDAIRYKLDTDGGVFFNASFNSVGGSSAPDDQCLPFDTSTTKTVTLGPSTSLVPAAKKRGTAMNFSDGGFMGYYIGAIEYDIIKITDTEMQVRAVMGGNPALAWYHIFTTQDPNAATPTDPDFTTLTFSDDFNVDGAPDATKWTAEIGNGTNGWGNNELQYYKAENAVVSGGSLKITAKKETSNGFQYTSARLMTHNKFDFTYGKVEIKAKLPSGGGTWPAFWMLGSNYADPGKAWPVCGEIDMMEHVGNNQNHVLGTLHMPGNSGGNGISQGTTVAGLSEDFHVYTLVWSATKITWAIDGVIFHTYNNTASTPFNLDFFMILNVAMGGNLGGAVDPAFTSSALEVDYIKIYQ